MIEEGRMLVGYSSTKGSIYFWRTVMGNPYISELDVDEEMQLIAKYCEEAYSEIKQSNCENETKKVIIKDGKQSETEKN